MNISVIICTHNPRKDYLQRTLESLIAQTLPKEQWELLLIDNASNQPLAGIWDLSWHPRGCHVREDQLGLTAARLRGIKESVSDILVFVDDDNLLAPDYLENALATGNKWEQIGVWGPGAVMGEFEIEPPEKIKPFLGSLALFVNQQDKWSNARENNHALPCGAGLCVKRVPAEAYAKSVAAEAMMRKLGRTGKNTASCEDTHLALVACDLGLLAGQIVSLKLTHLISAHRLNDEYFLKLFRGFGYSITILHAARGMSFRKKSLPRKILNRWRSRKKMPFERELQFAWEAGEADAIADLELPNK